MHIRSLMSLAVTVFALALPLSDCSGAKSSDSDSNSGATAAPVADAAASPTPADAAAAGDTPSNTHDPCVKLDVADVQPLYTQPLTKKKDDTFSGASAGCTFASAGNVDTLEIVSGQGAVAQDYWKGNAEGDPGPPVAGIGDRAHRSAHDVWIYALKGDVFCMVHSDLRARGHMAGLEAYNDKYVPDALAETQARKLGALCNKVFG